MTPEQFRAHLYKFGLGITGRQTGTHTIFIGRGGEVVSVRDPEGLTEEQRAEEIERLGRYLGIDMPNFGTTK